MKSAVVGQRAWVWAVYPNGAPLPQRTEVRVVKAGRQCVVETRDGTRHTIEHIHLDAGRSFETSPGTWRNEDDPLMLATLAKAIRDYQPSENYVVQKILDDWLAVTRWILARNTGG